MSENEKQFCLKQSVRCSLNKNKISVNQKYVEKITFEEEIVKFLAEGLERKMIRHFR